MEILYSDKELVVCVKPVGLDSEHEVPAALSKAIQEGRLVKEYVAMVHGSPPERGDWEDLLWKDSKKN